MPVIVTNTQVTSLSQAKNLGSWFGAQMNLNTHVTKCCQAAFFHFFNIRNEIEIEIEHEIVQILVNAFVTSRLDYCNSLLYGLPANQLNKLQGVQNAAARLICNISRFDHNPPVLFELHWLPIKYRISLRAGSRLGFMREMRDASGEAARAWDEVCPAQLAPRSRGFATRISHLAHKTQTRACSQASTGLTSGSC